MKKIYIVTYSAGSYDDAYDKNIFVTENKSKATRYVKRFNRLLKKWNEYYDQYAEQKGGIRWIKNEYSEKYFNRWHNLLEINRCFMEEIETR
jgi:hypothetical protein